MNNHVLVINSGSSSVKYQLIDIATQSRLTGGIIERIGESGSPVEDHETAVEAVLDQLSGEGHGVDRPGGLLAVGHRVVHGGDRFVDPTLIDDEVVAAIEALVPLAPLHNPGNLSGISALRRLWPDVPQVAVFDTAFHRDLPPWASTYAIPRDLALAHGVRRYGFHGTSFAFVCRQAAILLARPLEHLALVVLHLGNGSSAAAVLGGRSVDTSMGLSPLEGLVMGTRCGDLDPAVAFHLNRVARIPYERIESILTKQSGLKGLAGESDLRAVETLAAAGDADARLALDVLTYRIRKYVGAYYAAMGRLDAVVFTGGIGENAASIRASALDGLGALGIVVDEDRNAAPSREPRWISARTSLVGVLVVPTDEELEIARQTAALVQG